MISAAKINSGTASNTCVDTPAMSCCVIIYNGTFGKKISSTTKGGNISDIYMGKLSANIKIINPSKIITISIF